MNELIFFSINRYKNQIHTYTIYIHHLGLVDKSACIVLGLLFLWREEIFMSLVVVLRKKIVSTHDVDNS